MSYLEPFQSVALFENTFRHQLNKKTGKIDERKFVFNKHFGDGEGQLPVVSDRYRLIWMPGCPHSNKAMITLRLLGLDRVISVGECGVLRDPRGWIFSEDLGGVDPVLKIYYLDDAYLKGLGLGSDTGSVMHLFWGSDPAGGYRLSIDPITYQG